MTIVMGMGILLIHAQVAMVPEKLKLIVIFSLKQGRVRHVPVLEFSRAVYVITRENPYVEVVKESVITHARNAMVPGFLKGGLRHVIIAKA